MAATCLRTAFLALLGSLLATTVANALSLGPPQFGTPCIVESCVVFTSPNSSRLICINADSGKELWSRYTKADRWGETIAADGKVWVSEGVVIWLCDPRNGDFRPVGKMQAQSVRLVGAESNAVWVAATDGSNGHFLSEIDPQAGRELWRMTDGHDLVAATPEWALVGTQQRRTDAIGYPFQYEVTGATLEAISRRTGQRVWTYRPEWNHDVKHWWKNFNLMISGDKVVVLSNNKSLDCLRLSDGKSLVTIDVNKRTDGGNLELIDGKVIGCFVNSPFDGARRKFYELLLPDLFRKEFPSPPIDGTLMGITDGIGLCMTRFADNDRAWLGYDVRTGQKLWQKTVKFGGWQWKGSHAGFIYVSAREDSASSASILRVNLKTGEWKELFREKTNW